MLYNVWKTNPQELLWPRMLNHVGVFVENDRIPHFTTIYAMHHNATLPEFTHTLSIFIMALSSYCRDHFECA